MKRTLSFLRGSSPSCSNQSLLHEIAAGEMDTTCFASILQCMLLMSAGRIDSAAVGLSRDSCGHHRQEDFSRTKRSYILRDLALTHLG